MPIPVIDLFAGPGGLGEGFSSLIHGHESVFKIKLSIEKDLHAHQTLELRAFYRQFPDGKAPDEYYDYLGGKVSREDLFKKFINEAKKAARESWHAELGGKAVSRKEFDTRIVEALDSNMNWALIGGPPCQAYSLVGRSRVIGREGGENYEEGLEKYESDPRHNLYRQYLRILAVHQPPVFVMENVKGLLSAKRKEQRVFDKILADLKHPLGVTRTGTKAALEYRFFPLIATPGELAERFEPEDFVIRSEDFRIPQARHRIIILGLRSDWQAKPELLKPNKTPVAIEQVIADLPRLRSGLSKEPDSAEAWKNAVREIAQAARFGKDEISTEMCTALFKASERVGANLHRGGSFLSETVRPREHADWFSDAKLNGVCNHETRGHIRTDLHRYFFAAVFAQVKNHSPLLGDFPKALLPKHKNVAAALMETNFNDRFRVQIAGRPSTTVVSHIAKDGHYYIHYDPTQCRSLTVREAARLQTFPDNYFFEGPRTEQYKQVGNAVPPLLAKQIANIVADLFP